MSGLRGSYEEEESESLLADYTMSGPEGASTSYSIRTGPNGDTGLKSRRVSSDEELLDSMMQRDIGLERSTGFANIDHEARIPGK